MTTQDSAGTVHHAFTYDNLDHLQTEKGHTNHSYATDSIHNRLQKSGIAYEVNDINQIICQNNFKYRYDSNGNLTAKEKGNKKSTYRYDALDRLISVTSDSKETTYSYDAFNRRVSKTEQGVTTRYIYQGQNEIGAINAQGEITEFRILSPDSTAEIGSAIALEIHGKTYAPIHDRQGNVVCLIDASTGKPSETYRYTAFGEETIYNAKGQKIAYSQVGNPWRFSSKRVDPETGWIYFGRRYYDPEIGRWTTPDPLGFADGSNLYAYLHHKPPMMVDAYGLLGEAYRDFCKPEFSRDYFSNYTDDDTSSFSFRLERPERDNSSSIFGNTQERAGYISNTFSQATARICNGEIDFITHQLCNLTSIACCIGAYGL
jgi:RHS repeat-associated protein